MTLVAFAAERRAAGRPPLSIDISCQPHQRQQTRHTLLNRTERRTDMVSLHRPRRIVCKLRQDPNAGGQPRRFICTLIFATKADKNKKAKRRKYKLKKGRQKEIGLNTHRLAKTLFYHMFTN